MELFVKTPNKTTVYLKLENRVYPILEATTYQHLAGTTDWSLVKNITEQELATYVMKPRIFTPDGLYKLITN